MNKKKTPILQALRQRGGTVYVFPSASEDVGLNLQSSTTGAALSHYALLNIPALTKKQLLCNRELINDSSSFNGNNFYAMSLQNYMMNFETLLTNQDSYNYQEQSTVTEKVFWHWMNKIGALKYDNLSEIASTGVYYENTSNTRVVQCFGSIDAGNVLSSTFGMFNETYINVPSSYGNGPVYFSFNEDTNFPYNKNFTVDSSLALEGREDGKLHSSYTGLNDYPFVDNVTQNGDYQYHIEKVKKDGKPNDGLSIVKDLTTISDAVRGQYSTGKTIVNSYDDVNIDINGELDAQDFEFNAILLYYSIYDQDDLVKTPYAINLFGVIFLDGTEETTQTNLLISNSGEEIETNNAYFIPSLSKAKSSAESFGNSFSFRVNMKSMSVYDNTDAVIQDNTTISSIDSVDMSDVIANLNQAIDVLNSNVRVVATIQNNYASILNYYDNQAEEIENISTALNAYISGKRSSLIDTTVLKVKTVQPKDTSDNIISFYAYDSAAPDTETEEDQLKLIATVSEDGFQAADAVLDKIIYQETYVDVIDNTLESIEDSNYGKQTIDSMFNNHENLKIMSTKQTNQVVNGVVQSTKNAAYIDPNSTIFDTSSFSGASLAAYRINDNGKQYINYAGLIPYMIYKLQDLSMTAYSEGTFSEKKADEKYLQYIKSVSYSSLIALKQSNKLVPGQFYRILDYKTTSTQSDTSVADNQFDIIVKADSESAINEQAWAIQRAGDVYFANSNLNTWELKYDINNDTTKYAWADSTNGKGVIYYMKDEFGNECPYDFKNIKFTNFYYMNNGVKTNETTNYVYTFSSGINDATDYSLNGFTNNVYGNIIKPYISSSQFLNKIIFFGNNCYSNMFGNNCHSNMFGNGCYSNTFGIHCVNNLFGNECENNVFNNHCNCNILGNYCKSNTYESKCSYIEWIDASQQNVPFINNVHIFEGAYFVNFIYTQTTASNACLQNIQVMQGISGLYHSHKQITISKAPGDTYLTTIKSRQAEEILID